MHINKYTRSYGLVVITNDCQTVLIQRKFPYCVQDYIMEKKSNLDKTDFEKNWFPNHFTFEMKLDYIRFLNGHTFEDKFDFPHGQMYKTNCFRTAIREFREETGYTFDYIEQYLGEHTLHFIGLDNCKYIQTFFKIRVNALTEINNKKDTWYTPRIVSLKFARKLLLDQQEIKKDGKHNLI